MTISLTQRFTILERDEFTCRFCGRRAPETELEVDHIYPRSKGGSDEPANLVTACRNCNSGKGDRILRPLDPEPANEWASLAGASFLAGTVEEGPLMKGDILAEPTPGFLVAACVLWEGEHWSTSTTTRLVSAGEIASERWRLYRDERARLPDLMALRRARRPKEPVAGVPVAWATCIRSERTWIWLVERCPFCGQEHAHSAGDFSSDPARTLGVRRAQCSPDDERSYELSAAPF